jgi:hypothetical protein
MKSTKNISSAQGHKTQPEEFDLVILVAQSTSFCTVGAPLYARFKCKQIWTGYL